MFLFHKKKPLKEEKKENKKKELGVNVKSTKKEELRERDLSSAHLSFPFRPFDSKM